MPIAWQCDQGDESVEATSPALVLQLGLAAITIVEVLLQLAPLGRSRLAVDDLREERHYIRAINRWGRLDSVVIRRSKTGPGTEQQRPYSGSWYPECLGNLLVRRADIFTKREGHALALREREQHLHNLAASFLMLYRPPRFGFVRPWERIGHIFDRDESRRRSTTNLGDRGIRHDPAQPRLEAGCGARW
jgi:hypothetical protein